MLEIEAVKARHAITVKRDEDGDIQIWMDGPSSEEFIWFAVDDAEAVCEAIKVCAKECKPRK